MNGIDISLEPLHIIAGCDRAIGDLAARRQVCGNFWQGRRRFSRPHVSPDYAVAFFTGYAVARGCQGSLHRSANLIYSRKRRKSSIVGPGLFMQ